MTDPLPSSPIVPGRTTTGGPLLHLTVAVAPMRTAIMTTAGLARNTADWSSASVAAAETAGRLATRRQTIAATTRGLAALSIVLSIAPPSGTRSRGLRFAAPMRADALRLAEARHCIAPAGPPPQSIGRRTLALGCSTGVTTTNSRRPAGRRPGAESRLPADSSPGAGTDRPTRTSRAATGVKGPDTRNETDWIARRRGHAWRSSR